MSEDLPETNVRPYSPGELARFYGVSAWTFNRWLVPHLEAIGKREGLYFTTLQVRTIFQKLGVPGKFEEE
jgi:hypothetical protein